MGNTINDKINFMYSKSNKIEFMIYDNVYKVIEKKSWNEFLIDIKQDWKQQRGVVILSLIIFVNCIKNVIK